MDQPVRPAGNYITQAWLVILLALLYGGALAGVQMQLGPIIAENKRKETYDQIPQLVPGASQAEELMVLDKKGKQTRVYQALDAEGNVAGWVLSAGGQGYADRIELLVGLNPDLSAITGLFVLDQKETPGLGDFITGQDFRDRFKGKSTAAPLAVVTGEAQGANEIAALTGATISSQSVADIVNKSIENLRQPILEQNKP